MEGANIELGFVLKLITQQEVKHRIEKNQILYNGQCGNYF